MDKNLEEVMDKMLQVLDENNVSLEDGVKITANLFIMSLYHCGDEGGLNSLESMLDMLGVKGPSIGHDPMRNKGIFLGRGWGIDPALLNEDN